MARAAVPPSPPLPMRHFRPIAASLAALTLALGGCGGPDAPLTPTAPAPTAAPDRLLGGLLQPLTGVVRTVDGTLRTLLACPMKQSDTARAVIGPAGGALVAGGHRIDFPAGAVPTAESFVLRVREGSKPTIEAHAEGRPRYDFAVPVTVTLDLSGCGTLPSTIRAWHVDLDSRLLLEDMGGTLDAATGAFRFRTPHFSGYTIAWRSGTEGSGGADTLR